MRYRMILFAAVLFFSFGSLLAQAQPGDRIEVPYWFGSSVVAHLKASDSKKNNTTARRELKGAIPKNALDLILARLAQGDPARGVAPIVFEARDEIEEKGRINATFTLYGKSVSFLSEEDLRTRIRLRARIYLTADPDFSNIRRSEKMKDWVYLEIKIKNPSWEERDGANKFRIKLKDRDLLTLYRSDPTSPSFSALLSHLKTQALQLKGNTKSQVDAIFDEIYRITTFEDPDSQNKFTGARFIQPQFITTYTRKAYQYTEKQNLIPVPLPVKEGYFKCSLCSPLWSSDEIDYTLAAKDVQYQLTIDERVAAFSPEIHPEDQDIQIARYFEPDFEQFKIRSFIPYEGIRVAYPEDVRVVEFKEPDELKVAASREEFRSPTHRFLLTEIADRVKDSIYPKPEFQFNRGKAGSLTRLLRQEFDRRQTPFAHRP